MSFRKFPSQKSALEAICALENSILPGLHEYYSELHQCAEYQFVVIMCRSPGNQRMPGSFKQISGSLSTCTTVFCPPEVSNHVNSGTASMCETGQVVLNLPSTDVTSSSVECNVDRASSEGDSITLKSVHLEVKRINGFRDSLGLTEVGVEKEKGTLILQHVPKNGHVDFEAGQVTLNVTGEEGTVVVMGTEKSAPDAALNDGLLLSRPSEADSEEMKGGFRVAGASSTSMGEVSVPEAQVKPLSIGSETAKACQGIEESAVADGVLQGKTTEEEVVDGRIEISEVDQLQVEKSDAAKALELKMVEVIMQSPGLEVAESRVDGTLNPSSDFPLSVREHEDGNTGKDVMSGLSEEDKLTELFEPVVQLPEHLERANSFLGRKLDVDDQSNGKISDDLHSQRGRHANTQISQSQALEDPCSLQVGSNKDLDYTQQSGSDKGDDCMDRHDSEVVTPSAATSAQSQSSGLKVSVIIHNLLFCC